MSSEIQNQCGAVYPLNPETVCLKNGKCLRPNLHEGVIEKAGKPEHFVHWPVSDAEQTVAVEQKDENMESVLKNLREAQKALRTLEVSIAAVLSTQEGKGDA